MLTALIGELPTIENPANTSLTNIEIFRGSSKFPRVTELTASLDWLVQDKCRTHLKIKTYQFVHESNKGVKIIFSS